MAEEKKPKGGGSKKPPALLNRAAILEANDLKRELVAIPEWGGGVYVNTLTGQERDAWEAEIAKTRTRSGKVNFRGLKVKLVIASVEDEGGAKIFNQGDLPLLGEKSAKAIDRIFEVATRLSGLSDAEIDELAGN